MLSLSAPFRLASFNIYNFAPPGFAFYDEENSYTEQQWQLKTESLASIISQANPDVLCLQEVFCVESIKALLKPLGYQYFYKQQNPELQWGYLYLKPINMICSKTPADKVASLTGFERSPVRITINHTEIICLHLKSKRPKVEQDDTSANAQLVGSFVSDELRQCEAQALVDYMANIDHPCMVVGDYNDSQTSEFLKPLHKLAGSKFLNPSDIATHYFGTQGNTIDQLFVNQAWLSANPNYQVQVLDQHLQQQPTYNHQFISDHAMLVLTTN
ncbi:endonuclease/exonuclease/phosphatase family protein [Paraferrimonas sp. SM1919]|uniref:endonuclease/exonuclease/phosphatase family protein n=1 Tax=Paraferrimonas sp. SM1919 TaxID=2662263 RepID=UPI0013D881CF|nr:endonuclease/exonuclease/phosphatase family protein [Paraferrimonas sp. SM1919]